MASQFDVIVIGAGIVGASTAYHLKREGVDKVLLLESGSGPAVGTTGASAAIVRQHYSNEVLVRLTRESMEIFRELESHADQPRLFWPNGYYFLLAPDDIPNARANMDMQRSVGVETSMIMPDEFEARLPWLDPEGVGGVVHEPESGYADPVRSTEAFVERFRKLGGEVRFDCACDRLTRRNNCITGVEAGGSLISAGHTVNAAGPWSKSIAATAAIELPLSVYREQESIWECRHGNQMPPCSISDAVDAIYVRPQTSTRFTVGRGYPKEYSEVDPRDYNTGADDSFVQDVLGRAQRRFLPFAGARYVHGFSSLYDVSPDWYPIVGPREDVEGYSDASGGSGHGFKLAPALGRHLANWIISGTTSEGIARLSYDRIPSKRLFVQKYGGNRG